MRKICFVYLRKKEALVISAAMTTHGFEIAQEPVFRLVKDQSETAIGEAVLKALNSYRKGVAPLPPGDDRGDPVLQFVGVKTWGQLERTSRNILVKDESGSLSAVPTQRPPEGGYNHLNDLAVSCRAVPEEIGAAVRQAAQLCS
jgi:hypothetical protein